MHELATNDLARLLLTPGRAALAWMSQLDYFMVPCVVWRTCIGLAPYVRCRIPQARAASVRAGAAAMLHAHEPATVFTSDFPI